MIYRLSVPATIDDTDAVRVLEWHAGPGDAVAAGALIVELETHKALIEVRAGAAAILRRIACEEGAWCPLDGELALLSDTVDESIAGDAAVWAADFRIG